MKILIDVYDEFCQIKFEKIIDVASKELGQELIDALTFAVKKDCAKIVIFLHER